MDVEHLDVVLNAKLGTLNRNLDRADARLAVTERAMGNVKIGAGQAAETELAVDRITRAVGSVSPKAIEAADRLDRVKLGTDQAVETAASADVLERKLQNLREDAFLTSRGLAGVKISETQATESDVAASRIERALARIRRAGLRTRIEGGGGGGSGGRNGVGVGPFGSGFGRVGLLGAAVAGGATLGPAAGPAALGLLGAIPTLAAAGAGALGTLALAFSGVFKAIGGDKKAFDGLTKSQQQFVMTVRSLDGWLDRLKQTAAGAMFPGLTEALHSALSPATLNAVTTAVKGFGTAIGQAGAQWGKYFGSNQFVAIFGPLMKAGAQGLTIMSGAALSLFDALGVLGRAAIPFTTWLEKSMAAGARWLDTFLRAKSASGALGSALDEAKGSLKLVGNLVVSLARVVYALGAALYPVSKVLVADLTLGLNALAGIITRNEGVIQALISTALNGLVVAVKLAAGGIRLLNDGLAHIVGNKSKVVTAILAIGAVLALTLGPEAVVVVGAILAIGYIAKHWQQLGTLMVGVMHATWSALKGVFDLGVYGLLFELDVLVKGVSKAFGWLPFIGPKVKHALSAVDGYIESFRTRGIAEFATAGNQMGAAWGASFGGQVQSALAAAQAAQLAGMSKIQKQGFTTPFARKKPKPAKTAEDKHLEQLLKQLNSTAFGTPPPFDKNLGPKPVFHPLPNGLATQLANAQSAAAGGGLKQLQQLEQTEKRALAYLENSNATGKNLVAVAKERATLSRAIAATEKQITRELLKQKQAAIGRAEEKTLGLGPGGALVTPGRTALVGREHKILEDQLARSFGGKSHTLAAAAANLGTDVTSLLHKTNQQLIDEMKRLGVDLPKTTLTSLQKINEVLKNKFIPTDVRENIRARLQQIEEMLKASTKTLASNYKPVHSTDIVKGLGLDRTQKLAVEQRVSQALAHGGTKPTGPAAQGIPLTAAGAAGGGYTTITTGDFNITIEGAGKSAQQLAKELGPEIQSWLLKHEGRSKGRPVTVH